MDPFFDSSPYPLSFSLIFLTSLFLLLYSLILSSHPSLLSLPLMSFSYLSHLLNFYFFFSCLPLLSSSPTFLPFYLFSPFFSPFYLPHFSHFLSQLALQTDAKEVREAALSVATRQQILEKELTSARERERTLLDQVGTKLCMSALFYSAAFHGNVIAPH